VALPQVLAVTCNSASANDAMMEALATILTRFPGQVNRVCCFAHVLNLVVKAILCQFDTHVSKGKKANAVMMDAQRDLAKVAKDLEDDSDNNNGDDEDANNVFGLDDIEHALEKDIEAVADEVQPVRDLLTKVSPYSHGPTAAN
jgi:hypothetical protein